MKVLTDPAEFISGFYYIDPMAELPELAHCGEALCVAGFDLTPDRHRAFEFLFLVNGKMDWRVGDQTISQGPGDLVLFYPQEEHSSAWPAQGETQQCWIALDLDRLGPEGVHLANRLRDSKARLLRNCHPVEPILSAIVRQIIKPLPLQKQVVLGYIRIFITLLEQHLDLQNNPAEASASRHSYRVQKAISYMEINLNRRIPLTELSAVATERQTSHFCARFRREVGDTPAAHHLKLRLIAAREHLLKPQTEITDVAQRFGFSSSQHFSSAFRRTFGTTPRQWRSHNLARLHTGA